MNVGADMNNFKDGAFENCIPELVEKVKQKTTSGLSVVLSLRRFDKVYENLGKNN